jgi:hypothetical protein
MDRGAWTDQVTRRQPTMSAIMYDKAVDGTTISLRIVTDSGDEIDYSSGRGLTMAIEDSPRVL